MKNNKRKNFDIGDMVVITHELNSTMYIVSGVKENKLGVVDPIRALVVDVRGGAVGAPATASASGLTSVQWALIIGAAALALTALSR